MSMTFCFFSLNRRHTSNLHLQWSFYESFALLYPAKSWNSTPVSNGTAGPSNHAALMIAQLPTFKLQKITTLIEALCQNRAGKTLRRSLALFFGLHPWYITPGFFLPPFTETSMQYQRQITAYNQLDGHSFSAPSMKTLSYLPILPLGGRIVEFKHKTITSKTQLPIDIPIERHAWVRIRDPNTDKLKLSEESKLTLLWIKTSLLPLLSSIPLNRSCHLTINAAADASATDDTMGIGGWVTINSSTFWFSQIWNTDDLQRFLPISKVLQRYITSWEALAQLCVILTVCQKCETRPGIINIHSGSDNTGAEANVNQSWLPHHWGPGWYY